MELLEGTNRCSEDLLEQTAANTLVAQVLPVNSSGMAGGIDHMPPMPLELDGSVLPHPGMQQGGRPLVRFFCPVCPKGFRSKLDMERHLRTHTGEKPFKCPYCPHRSATKGNLKAHMRHIHMDIIMPF